jgi:hypothetical protein
MSELNLGNPDKDQPSNVVSNLTNYRIFNQFYIKYSTRRTTTKITLKNS